MAVISQMIDGKSEYDTLTVLPHRRSNSLIHRCVNEMIRHDYATFGGPENTSTDARPASAGPVIAQGASLIHSFANAAWNSLSIDYFQIPLSL